MAAKAGERVQETGDFRCEKCGEKVHVNKGTKIPKCPKCGNGTFKERENEPGRKKSSRK